MFRYPFLLVLAGVLTGQITLAEPLIPPSQGVNTPAVGEHHLRVLSPRVLELSLVTTKRSQNAPATDWNFVDGAGKPRLPNPASFQVTAGNRQIKVKEVGFKRRPLYAPLKKRDLRIGNQLYLQLEEPVAPGEPVQVRSSAKPWPPNLLFKTDAHPLRWSPVIHVNQVGYLPGHPKTAMIGYYLGSLGELDLVRELAAAQTNNAARFHLVDVASGKPVFEGELKPRPDQGFPFASYQKVLEADFSNFKQPGSYAVHVPGLGVSFPFQVSDDTAAALARTYALGIYHQRCGTGNELPFTRFTHGPCHTAPAEVPTAAARFESVHDVLAKETEGAREERRHSARALSKISDCLYPFVQKGPVPVRGGHHDAGDYSKYTINSAQFIHFLVFAADNFPGSADLDNLGIPESGDGKSDLLQEAKWEADFLARMQDQDGGFYFLVYPRDRRYENDVTPDKGDPQVVFPKTTAVTAAATAALAQCASSPTFKKQFPEAAALYLTTAKKGWAFLEKALAKHGKDGAYQKITHYGNDFLHDDELAWAACELFVATGDPKFQQQLTKWFDPASPDTKKWSWWRLFEANGHAIRSYAFAARSGRLEADQLDPRFLRKCEEEIISAGEEQLTRAERSAYGTSFPTETKSTRSAGWYFSSDAAFDLAVACQIDFPERKDPRPKMVRALLSNVNYEFGCNPVNVCYITGIGWNSPLEIVHQYAQNDRRSLPPSGIPLGSIQDGFGWIDHYGKELGELAFPPDDDKLAPYPFYDRWGDSFNLKTEFVISNQARGLAYLSWLMAQTPLKTQSWKPVAATIQFSGASGRRQPVTAELQSSLPGFEKARIVWEAENRAPFAGSKFTFTPERAGSQWIEAEALLPDGRRVFATSNFNVR